MEDPKYIYIYITVQNKKEKDKKEWLTKTAL